MDIEKNLSENFMLKCGKNTTICPDEGKSAPNDKLSVAGTIFEDRVKVDTDSESWKDSTYCPLLLFLGGMSLSWWKTQVKLNMKIWGHFSPFGGISAPKTKAIFDHEGVFVGKKLINPYL